MIYILYVIILYFREVGNIYIDLYFREVGKTGDMSYINLQPVNSLSERFLLGGRFNLRSLSSANNRNDFLPREEGVLKKYTSYQISVTPYNKQGIGPSSSSVVATTMEDGKKFEYLPCFNLYLPCTM